MPKYENDFYFEREKSENNYGDIPSGQWDLMRLIEQKPYWRKPQGKPILLKKTLILDNDPYEGSWTSQNKLNAADKLLGLQEEGFELYFYQHDNTDKKLIAFDFQLLYTNNAWSSFPASLSYCQKTLNKAPEELLILSKEHCLTLFSSESPRGLPPLKTLDCHRFDHDIGGTGGDVNEVFFLIRETQHLKTLRLRDIQDTPNLMTLLNLHSHDFSPLEHLEITDLDDVASGVDDLLSQTPKLKSLMLNAKDKQYVHGAASFPTLKMFEKTIGLKQLEILAITNIMTDPSNIEILLKNTTLLKSLVLKNVTSHFSYLAITSPMLNALNQNTRLETLTLEGVSFSYNEESLRLASLKHLTLESIEISYQQLARLLSQTPWLETLKMKQTSFEKGPKSKTADELSSLPQVKKIHFNHIEMNIKQFKNILEKTSNISELKLKKVQISWGDEIIDTPLSQLEKLQLKDTVISSAMLESIIRQAPILKELSIEHYKTCYFTDFKFFDVSNLETVKLSPTNISLSVLSDLLLSAKKLKHLTLYEAFKLSDGELSEFDAPNLEIFEVHLSYGTRGPSVEAIKKLIDNAPKLHTLIINGEEKLLTQNKQIDLWLEKILAPRGLSERPEELTHGSNRSSSQGQTILFSSIKNTYQGVKNLLQPAEVTPSLEEDNADNSPLKSLSGNTSINLDANTALDDNKVFNIKRVFFSRSSSHPEPNDYRLSSFNVIAPNPTACSLDKAFSLKQSSNNLQLTSPKNMTQSDKPLYKTLPFLPGFYQSMFCAKVQIKLSEQWQALPSLSAIETLTHYYIADPSVYVEIQYSERDNLYYLRSSSPSEETIDFEYTISVPQPRPKILPKGVQALIKSCQNFKEGALVFANDSPKTGFDYLAAMEAQSVGACRHRSAVFLFRMQTRYPNVPVRMINNDCHSFVELQLEGTWQAYNLGGYAAKLNIKDSNDPSHTITHAREALSLPTNDEVFSAKLNKKGLLTEKVLYFKDKYSKPHYTSLIDFNQKMVSNNQKVLLTLNSSNDLSHYRYHLQTYLKDSQHACFYAHNADALICSAHFLWRDQKTNIGNMQEGPGGPLFNFINRYSNEPVAPVIIINYDHFSPSEIIRFNALLDDIPMADGTPLSKNIKVIGLINPNKPTAYIGNDFTSRFNAVETVPFSSEVIQAPLIAHNLFPSDHEKIKQNIPKIIELYGGEHWQTILLGHWQLKGHEFTFIEGEFIQAIRAGIDDICLSNAPWSNDEFVSFLQEALLNNGVMLDNERITLPSPFQLTQKKGYELKEKAHRITVMEQPQVNVDTLVLNSATISIFFDQYQCHNEQLFLCDGLIKSHAGEVLFLYLSEKLPNSAWAKLLDTCQRHEVDLTLSCAPDILPPSALGITLLPQVKQPATPWPLDPATLPLKTLLCQSKNAEATAKTMTNAIIIDISEMEVSNLLFKIDGNLTIETNTLRFHEQKGVLEKLLQEKKTVVLKGTFSDEMTHHLTAYALKRAFDDDAKGKLILIDEREKNAFPLMACFYHNTPAIEEDITPDIPPLVKTINATLRINTLEKEAVAFDEKRLAEVNEALSDGKPFTFLSGMTGVGKTSFIENIWKKQHPALYMGETQIEAWALDRSPGKKVLFIDEANLSSCQWSNFDGLFQTPKHIIIGNTYYPLDETHQVIFAGNPLSYGGERQMPSLFRKQALQYGTQQVLFEPMNGAYLAYHMLNPILSSVLDGKALIDAMQAILDIAQHLSSLSETEVLITPRELSMISLFTANHCQTHPKDNAKEVAKYYAYHLAKPFVPEAQRLDFDRRFSSVSLEKITRCNELIVNDTNRLAVNTVTDYIALRRTRQRQHKALKDKAKTSEQDNVVFNETQKIQLFGGLGGLTLEGEPGAGKSKLVMQCLVEQGLKKNKDFYSMPVSMPLSEKEALLLKAFHEGAVVVIDEINSSPMMERLLNHLLMGKTAEGKFPDNPGFLIIGTQNPASMGGRNKASPALAHRMQSLTLANYTPKEMQEILIHEGLNGSVAEEMIAQYLIKKDAHKLCFRDLYQRAKQTIKSKQCAMNSDESSLRLSQKNTDLVNPDETSKKPEISLTLSTQDQINTEDFTPLFDIAMTYPTASKNILTGLATSVVLLGAALLAKQSLDVSTTLATTTVLGIGAAAYAFFTNSSSSPTITVPSPAADEKKPPKNTS